MRFKQMRLRHLLPGVALAAGLAACSDTTSPGQGLGLDPQATENAAAQLNSISNQPLILEVFTSALSFDRVSPGTGTQLSRLGSQLAAVNALRLPSSSRISPQIRASIGATGLVAATSLAPIVPPEAGGKTFVRVNGVWQVDANAAALPSTQVRFMVSNASGQLGQVDIYDLTPAGGNSVSYRATFTSVTGLKVLDYTSTYGETQVNGETDAVSYHMTGTLQNASTALNFTNDLKETGIVNGPEKLSLTMHTDVPTLSVSTDLVAAGTVDDAGNMDFSQADYTVTVNGKVIKWTFDPAAGSASVYVNGQLFATVTTDANGNLAFSGAGGRVLSSQDKRALAAVSLMLDAVPPPIFIDFLVVFWLYDAVGATTV